MANSLSFSTLNVRSIATDKKRDSVKDWIDKHHRGILFLQETHADETMLTKWQKDWPYQIYVSNGTKRSGGVAILIPNDIDHKIRWRHNDNYGNLIILGLTINNEDLTLANCYFPTKDKQTEQLVLLEILKDVLIQHDNESIILGGDFNITLDPNLDKIGGTDAKRESVKYRAELKAFIEALALSDVLRNKLGNQTAYTWHSKHLKVYSRLDYFFISEHFLNRIQSCNKHTAILTDHDLVKLTLQCSLPGKGRGYWKFNTSLLKDKTYIAQVKETVTATTTAFDHLQNKGLLWDFIKMKIRGMTIKYCGQKKREREVYERNINKQLLELDLKPYSEDNVEQISLLKSELETIIQMKTEGAIVRSQVQWAEEGERNTSFFLNLEKHNAENKIIQQLKVENKTITDSESILIELQNFYKKLYSKPLIDTQTSKESDKLFLDSQATTLNDAKMQLCEGLVSRSECLNALKTMSNRKSPGSDGFSAEFYNFFWNDISKHVLNSLNHAFTEGELSVDQKRGLISLIPKKGKDRIYIKNWRPIALLNTDYKLLAKILAGRLKFVIDELIDCDQTGYITGRYIGENIRTVSDVIEYLNANNKSGIILLIDFEKAFDTISWDFIDKALHKFNFGPTFRHWVKVLYTDSKSAVINNGNFTEFFNLERGVRQGCPLSTYLFLLVVELLSINIRNNKQIEGIKLKNCTLKISQMADDTTIFVSSSASIPQLLSTLSAFAISSGLKTNVEKTKVYPIHNPLLKAEHLQGLKFEKGPINLLGITVTNDVKINKEKNVTPKLNLMKNLLRMWSTRNISLKGKITVINSLIVSLFVYPATIMDIDKESLDDIDKCIFSFLWNGKKAKIAKVIIQNQIEKGGLKMPNIYLKVKAWKLMWLKRAIIYEHRKWVAVLNTILKDLNFTDLLQTSPVKENIYVQKLPKFYQNIIKDWASIKTLNINSKAGILNQVIWYNNKITIENKPFLWLDWYKKGIFKIKHLINSKGGFLMPDELRIKNGISCNFLQNLQIRQSIPLDWRQKIISAEQLNTKELNEGLCLDPKNKLTDLNKLTSKQVYWHLISLQKCKLPSSISKWHETFQVPVDPNINPQMWEIIFTLPFKSCDETYLQSFQYKIIHRIIPCNYWLHVLKVKENPECERCKVNDTIPHYFIHCSMLNNFWTFLSNWWLRTFKAIIPNEDSFIIFGIETDTHSVIFNYMLILAKWYIYRCKAIVIKNIDFFDFLQFLKSKLVLKQLYYKYNDKMHAFDSKWGALFESL